MADDRDLEVTQVDENRRNNSQRSLFFKDLDELLSEYQPTNDIAITESSTIRLENAVQALQNVCHFLSYQRGGSSGNDQKFSVDVLGLSSKV